DALEGGDRLAFQVADLELAGGLVLAIDDDGAGPALAGATAVLGRLQLQVVAQRLQQRGGLVNAKAAGLAVDGEVNVSNQCTNLELKIDPMKAAVLAPRGGHSQRLSLRAYTAFGRGLESWARRPAAAPFPRSAP